MLLLLLLVLLASPSFSHDLVGWSSSPTCPTSLSPSTTTLIFAYRDFTAGEFAKRSGAYSTKEDGFKSLRELNLNTCVFTVKELPKSSVSGADVKGVAAAKAGRGVVVVDMGSNLKDRSATDDVLIAETIRSLIQAKREFQVYVGGLEDGPALARRMLAGANANVVRMNPDIFFALLFTVLAVLLLTGFLCCCMDGIQSQSRYAKQYPAKGKEQN